MFVLGAAKLKQLDGLRLGKAHAPGLTRGLAQQRLLGILGRGQVHRQREARRYIAAKVQLGGIGLEHQRLHGRLASHADGGPGIGRVLADQVDEAGHLRGHGRQAGQLVPKARVAEIGLAQVHGHGRAAHVAVNGTGLAASLVVVGHTYLVAELDGLKFLGTPEVDVVNRIVDTALVIGRRGDHGDLGVDLGCVLGVHAHVPSHQGLAPFLRNRCVVTHIGIYLGTDGVGAQHHAGGRASAGSGCLVAGGSLGEHGLRGQHRQVARDLKGRVFQAGQHILRRCHAKA